MKKGYRLIIFLFLFSMIFSLTVSAAGALRGDVNADGFKNTTDALYLLRHLLMPHMYPIDQSADMNRDGRSSTEDALYLLRHILLPTIYPLESCQHNESVLPEKAPTCTETGLTEGKVCSVCGETLVKQTALPATGHRYVSSVIAPTCTEKGYTNHACVCHIRIHILLLWDTITTAVSVTPAMKHSPLPRGGFLIKCLMTVRMRFFLIR